jgi:hypothetical protein
MSIHNGSARGKFQPIARIVRREPRRAGNCSFDGDRAMEGSTMTALREAALRYASLGLHVLPLHQVIFEPSGPRCSCGRPRCQSPGEHPRTKRGFKDASNDAAHGFKAASPAVIEQSQDCTHRNPASPSKLSRPPRQPTTPTSSASASSITSATRSTQFSHQPNSCAAGIGPAHVSRQIAQTTKGPKHA